MHKKKRSRNARPPLRCAPSSRTSSAVEKRDYVHREPIARGRRRKLWHAFYGHGAACGRGRKHGLQKHSANPTYKAPNDGRAQLQKSRD